MIQAILQVLHPYYSLTTTSNITQRLGRWLDRPFFPWKRLVIGFSLAEFTLENWLLWRQYKVLNRGAVPKALSKEIEQTTFDKSQVRLLCSIQGPHILT